MSDYYTIIIYDIFFYIIIIITINITILNTRGYLSHQETALRYLDEDFLKESLELAKTAGIDEVRLKGIDGVLRSKCRGNFTMHQAKSPLNPMKSL